MIINGSIFSANKKNIFDVDVEPRKSVELIDSSDFFHINNGEKNFTTNVSPNLENLLYKIDESAIYNLPKSKFSYKNQSPKIDQVFVESWKADCFEMGPCLGRGKFSSVYLAKYIKKFKRDFFFLRKLKF